MRRLQQTDSQNVRGSLFLDTATQIARHWHSKEERTEIERQLYGRKLYCSRYVKCQYKATLLDSIIKLHNLLVRYGDLQQAQQKATEGRFSREAGVRLTPGVLARVVSIATWIYETHKTYEGQREVLRDLIEDTWETLFGHRIQLPLIDATNCMYADGPPKMGVTGRYESVRALCRKKPSPECAMKRFWQERRHELRLLATIDVEAIKAKRKDKADLDMVKRCAGEIRTGGLPFGNVCTKTLSDAVICIESQHCPERVSVHSTNRKHFEPLCEVLGLTFEPSE